MKTYEELTLEEIESRFPGSLEVPRTYYREGNFDEGVFIVRDGVLSFLGHGWDGEVKWDGDRWMYHPGDLDEEYGYTKIEEFRSWEEERCR